MTATIAALDVDVTVKRADGRWASRNGDEPASPDYLKHMADAVRPLLGQPAGPVDDIHVQQLLADKQRLDDLVTELRKHVTARDKTIERQNGDAARLKSERDEARAERDTARAQLRDRPTDTHGKLVAAAAEVTTREKLATSAAEVERLTAEVARLNQLLAAREIPEHSCLYPLAEPGAEPGPCEVCERPYPRSADAYELEDVEPTVEPWAALFGQIRDEAKKAGWKA